MRLPILAFCLVFLPTVASAHGHRHSGYADGRPSAWCGWEMRRLVGSDPGIEYNLARNWAHWGHAASGPEVGTVVVWSHHVGLITGRIGNQWIVKSGNDGHRVRERARSIAGAIAFRLVGRV